MDANYAILIGLLVLVVIGILIAMLRTDRDHKSQRVGYFGDQDFDDDGWSWGECDSFDND